MGCGASAIKEQPLHSGPVGSARSLAQWKRGQQGQTRLVDCSFPTSNADVKAAKEDTPSEVETSFGGCSTDGAPTECSQSRPASRESMATNEAAQVPVEEIKCKQLRLQMSKACVMAAQSGVLAAAFQQVGTATQASVAEIRCKELRLRMSKACVLASQSGDLASAFQQVRTTSQSKEVTIIAPAGKPSSRRPVPGKNKTAKTSEKLPTGTKSLQKTDSTIDELRQRAKEALENATRKNHQTTEPMQKSCSNEDLDRIRTKAIACLEDVASRQGTFDNVLAGQKKDDEVANCGSQDEDLQSIKKKAAEGLVNLFQQGHLENMLRKSLEATSQTEDSGLVYPEMGDVAPRESLDVESIRRKVVSCLEKASTSGSLETPVSSTHKPAKANGDELEQIRQKTVACLVNAVQSGRFENVILPPPSKKIDDDAIKHIKQRVAVSFLKAADSGSLAGALNEVTTKSAAIESQKMKIRSCLEQAAANGILDKAIANMQ